MKKISIILSCYNDEYNLRKVLDSYLAEKEYICEILLIDDGSTDKSRQLMIEYATREDVISPFYFDDNEGLQNRVLQFLSKCSGKYFILGSSNDCIKNNFLSDSFNYLESNPSVGFFTGNTEIIYKEQNKTILVNILDFYKVKKYCNFELKELQYVSPTFLIELLQKRLFYSVFGQSTLYKTSDIVDFGYDRTRFGFWHDNFYPWIIGLRCGFAYSDKIYSQLLVEGQSWHIVEHKSSSIRRHKSTGKEMFEYLTTFSDVFPALNRSGILGRVSRFNFQIFLNPVYWNYFNMKNWILDQKIVIKTYLNNIKI